jgi:hypothetical protein
MNEIHKTVLADLVREHPLPRVRVIKKSTRVKSGVRAGAREWFLLFKSR